MDQRDIEQGYADFHRALNHILRQRDVRAFKRHVAGHPGQTGRLSHCLGLSDDLAEVEMHKAILARAALKDLHQEAAAWLRVRDIEPPSPRPRRIGRRGKKYPVKRGKRNHE